jgi:dTDP-4-amino-4,6-dideoxy-D-galactose acyltransferase
VSSTSLSPRILNWDSQLFGFPVARLAEISSEPFLLKNTLSQLQREGVRLVYANTTGGKDIQAIAAQAGGVLVDRRVTYTAKLIKTDTVAVPRLGEIVPFTGTLTPALEALALASGVYSRFNIDPLVPRSVFETLFKTWIAKSVSGELAERVFVARSEGVECGFVTVTSEGDRGAIGLIAVEERLRGQGFGRALVSLARHHHLAMGKKFDQVVTQQNNRPACRLYETSGYSLDRTEFVYHFWLR